MVNIVVHKSIVENNNEVIRWKIKKFEKYSRLQENIDFISACVFELPNMSISRYSQQTGLSKITTQCVSIKPIKTVKLIGYNVM